MTHAIVLLGCRIEAGGRPGAAAQRRADAAARAWHDGVAKLVVASGGRRWREISEAEALAEALVGAGVAPDAIVRELCSLSTRENALYSARILRARGARRVAVVTCDWHLPRALVCFRAAGLDAIGIPAQSPPAGLATRARRALGERIAQAIDRALPAGGLA
jgi:uncharacterized SAM-binding protein YcdF (DUF218 family)